LLRFAFSNLTIWDGFDFLSMIKQLAHVCLHSEDLEETARFYCQGLGMEIAFELPDGLNGH
jgi:catechol-2,3-dioxygenase